MQKEINGVIYDGLCSVLTGKETIPCKYTGGMRFEMDTIEGKVFPSGIVYAFDGDRKSKVTKEGDQHWFYFNGIELNYPDKENIEIYKDGSKQGIKIKGERKPRIKADTYDELIPVTGTKYYYRETKTSYSLMTHFIARIGDKYGLVHYTGAVIIPVTYAGYDPLDDGRTQLTAVYLWSPFKGANASQKKALDCNGDPYKMTKRTSEERQKYYDEENRKEIEKNREDYQRRLNSGK